jgi:hypothetical protein
VPCHPLGVVTTSDVPQQAIDEAGKRLHAFVVGAAVSQYERKVVAQRRKIPVTRE